MIDGMLVQLLFIYFIKFSCFRINIMFHYLNLFLFLFAFFIFIFLLWFRILNSNRTTGRNNITCIYFDTITWFLRGRLIKCFIKLININSWSFRHTSIPSLNIINIWNLIHLLLYFSIILFFPFFIILIIFSSFAHSRFGIIYWFIFLLIISCLLKLCILFIIFGLVFVTLRCIRKFWFYNIRCIFFFNIVLGHCFFLLINIWFAKDI